jgi:transposase
MDRAGWPMSERLVIPSGIYVEYLPAYSPELQPAERLWSVTDEPLYHFYKIVLQLVEVHFEI